MRSFECSFEICGLLYPSLQMIGPPKGCDDVSSFSAAAPSPCFTRLGSRTHDGVYTDRAGACGKGSPQLVSVCDSPWFNWFAFDALVSLCCARSYSRTSCTKRTSRHGLTRT